jgi:hypothetical protein
MGPLDALWHLLNFFAPAVGVALFTAVVAKRVWRRDLAAVSWRHLLLWGYAMLVVATALALWWVGFLRR